MLCRSNPAIKSVFFRLFVADSRAKVVKPLDKRQPVNSAITEWMLRIGTGVHGLILRAFANQMSFRLPHTNKALLNLVATAACDLKEGSRFVSTNLKSRSFPWR